LFTNTDIAKALKHLRDNGQRLDPNHEKPEVLDNLNKEIQINLLKAMEFYLLINIDSGDSFERLLLRAGDFATGLAVAGIMFNQIGSFGDVSYGP